MKKYSILVEKIIYGGLESDVIAKSKRKICYSNNYNTWYLVSQK